MPYEIYLFDFDYTLVDSSEGIVRCALWALAELGYKNVSAEAIRQTIGHTLPEAYQILTGDGDQARGLKFEQLFRVHQVGVMTKNTHLFDHVPEVLAGLQASGARLGIVSTKLTKPIYELLDREGLVGYFDVVIGAEHVAHHKPHPQGLQLALTALKRKPQDALFVGDSVFDAGAARNAALDFAGVLTGRTTREQLAHYPHRAIADHLKELHGQITNWSSCEDDDPASKKKQNERLGLVDL
jgi:phosphoglycolate phosphatase